MSALRLRSHHIPWLFVAGFGVVIAVNAVMIAFAIGSFSGLYSNHARERGLNFEILLNPTRTIERIYQTTGVPESFVLNRDGVIVKKVIGATEWDSAVNRDLIRRLLAQKG